MASIVYINRQVPAGSVAWHALDKIREGIGTLMEYNGVRAQAIGVGDDGLTMASVFGCGDGAQGQALNDRWNAFLDAYSNPANPAYDEYAILRDLVDALVAS